jgi:hypothetical protein
MKRRAFVEKLGIGSAMLAMAGAVDAAQNERHEHQRPLTDPRSNATVSFGAWPVGTVEEPLDRTVTPYAPMAPNVHALLPQVATIKQGGAVNFVIAGFHQILVYAPRTRPQDIDTSVLLPVAGAPATVGLIDDPNNRIYRGLDPRLLGNPGTVEPAFQDRVEVVGFSRRGTYLVICAVNVHFADGMFGWVKVVR